MSNWSHIRTRVRPAWRPPDSNDFGWWCCDSATSSRCMKIGTYALGISGTIVLILFLIWHQLIIDGVPPPPSPIVLADVSPGRLPLIKCGLPNLGNTCFLNAALQCLRHNQAINRFLNRIADMVYKDLPNTPQGRWLAEYMHLVVNVNGGERSRTCHQIDPWPAYEALLALSPGSFQRGHQADSSDVFYQFFIAVEAVLKRDQQALSRWHSIIRFANVPNWDEAAPITDGRFGYHYNLMISLPDQRHQCHLETLLEQHFNSQGDADSSHRRIGIADAPIVAVIVFNRIDMYQQRIQTPVRVPMHLDLSRFMVDGTGAAYDLVGVVHHHGQTATFGHYTATVRMGPNSNDWFQFNDDLPPIRANPREFIDARFVYLVVYQMRDR